MSWINKRNIVRFFRRLRRERHLNARRIDNFIMAVIIVNAITLGMETSSYLNTHYGIVLKLVDNIALGIFTFEIGTKMLIKRLRFFRDPWNVFDFLIIGASLLTFIPQLSMLRSLRILRIFLLLSFMPKLRFIVQSLLLSLPGIFSITILLTIMFYVFGVIATQTFGGSNPLSFGTLGRSLYSLFRIMTLDGCWDIINAILKNHPYAYLFFIPFILLGSYIIMNIFIAIIINSMRETRLRSEEKVRQKALAEEIEAEEKLNAKLQETLMQKLNEINGRLVRMEEEIRKGRDAGA